jgi:pimeloyl-ACP methyl ester carboxylesterase
MASTATMETITSADGTPIAFVRAGRGPPFVLVHGTSADYTSWSGVRPAFEEHLTVYAVDRRGRGESGDAADYTLAREFEDVAAVVEGIDDPVVLFGHSFGALCCLGAALRTDNLRALVLYEPAIPFGGHELYSEDVLAELSALLDDGENERALLLFLREVAELPPAQVDALRAAPNWPARVAAAHTVLRELEAEAAYEFDAARFEGVTTPTLLLSGGESPQWSKDLTAAIGAALPNSRIAVLEGQEHVAYYTDPDRFVGEILAFIRETS